MSKLQKPNCFKIDSDTKKMYYNSKDLMDYNQQCSRNALLFSLVRDLTVIKSKRGLLKIRKKD